MEKMKRGYAVPVRNITELIGNTPLVKLNKLDHELPGDIYAKLEFFNPGGSIKDRVAKAMVEAAERDGRLKPGMTIVEPTSGNTGIGLSLISAAKGYRMLVVMPENMSGERRKLMKAFGAELVLTPASGGMKAAIEKADELVGSGKEYFMPQQFKNPANPEAHRRTTALEIWEQTNRQIDCLIAGVGTGGTITGISETLKDIKFTLRTVAVEPSASNVLSGGRPGRHGIQGIGAGFIPDILNMDIIDEIMHVDDRDAALMTRILAKKEGIFAGISSGAALWAAVLVASRPECRKKTIVVILPDSGERYLSTDLFDG